jgi:hypothetical protein
MDFTKEEWELLNPSQRELSRDVMDAGEVWKLVFPRHTQKTYSDLPDGTKKWTEDNKQNSSRFLLDGIILIIIHHSQPTHNFW